MNNEIKSQRYERIFQQLDELFKKTADPVARMATANALLFNKMDHFFWCGFYLLHDGELTVGPYQGSLACLVLKKNTGVCWAGINQKKTLIVADINQFPGHIACDSRSQSEIVVPLRDCHGEIIGIFDVDCDKPDAFDEIDARQLEKVASLIMSGT